MSRRSCWWEGARAFGSVRWSWSRVLVLVIVVSGLTLVVSLPLSSAAQTSTSALVQRGIELLEANRVDEAVEELRVAVRLSPADPVGRYHFGRALFAARELDEALIHLEFARDATSEPGPVEFLLGQAYLEVGRLTEAAAALEAAGASRSDYPPIDYYRAEVCYRGGYIDRAREWFAELAEASPGWGAPVVRLGVIAMQLSDPALAAEQVEVAIQRSPDQPALWLRLGGAHAALGDAEAAIVAYRAALELSPAFVPARVALASELRIQRQEDEALVEYREILRRSPNHGVARLQVAEILAGRGEREVALAEVEQAANDLREFAVASATDGDDRAPSRQSAAELRAVLLMQLGRGDEASAAARAILGADPRSVKAYFVLGTILIRGGDALGQDHLRMFKRLTDAAEQRELGDYNRKQVDDPERARAAYLQALGHDPTDPGSLLGLGALLRRAGDFEAAIETLEAAAAAGRDDAELHREWVLASLQAGREEQARAALGRARAAGHTLGPLVWSALKAPAEVCS